MDNAVQLLLFINFPEIDSAYREQTSGSPVGENWGKGRKGKGDLKVQTTRYKIK